MQWNGGWGVFWKRIAFESFRNKPRWKYKMDTFYCSLTGFFSRPSIAWTRPWSDFDIPDGLSCMPDWWHSPDCTCMPNQSYQHELCWRHNICLGQKISHACWALVWMDNNSLCDWKQEVWWTCAMAWPAIPYCNFKGFTSRFMSLAECTVWQIQLLNTCLL